MGIFDDLRLKYKTGQLTVKFIFINVALFLVVRLTDVFCTLLGVPFSLTPYLELPSVPYDEIFGFDGYGNEHEKQFRVGKHHTESQ